MASIREKREQRRQFLIELYRQTDGNRLSRDAHFQSVAASVGVANSDEAQALAHRVVDEGLADFPVMGGFMVLTPAGINVVETWLEEEEEDEDAAASLSGVLVIVSAEEKAQLEPVLAEVRDLAEALPDREAAAEVRAQLDSAHAQLLSPRPRRAVLREIFLSMRTIGEQIAAQGIVLGAGKALGIIA